MCKVQEADESVVQEFESRYEAKVSVAKHKIHAIQEKHRLAAQIEVEALQKTWKRPFWGGDEECGVVETADTAGNQVSELANDDAVHGEA